MGRPKKKWYEPPNDEKKGSLRNNAVLRNKDPYENLANAIILLAVDDYLAALEKIQKWSGDKDAIANKKSLERFFRSQWFVALTSVDAELLIAGLKAKIKT